VEVLLTSYVESTNVSPRYICWLYIPEPLNPYRWFLFENSLEHVWSAISLIMRNLRFLTKQFKRDCHHHRKTGLGKFSLWSSQCLEYEVQFPCGNFSCWIYFASKESAAETWSHELIFLYLFMWKEFLVWWVMYCAEDCNRLWASLYWSFWFFKCAFLMLGCKRYWI